MEKNRHFQLLDCSLREEEYYIKWDFETSFVKAYLNNMNDLPMDYVENGYRSNLRKGYLGAYFYCPDYKLEAATRASSKKLAIILNEKEVELSDLDRLLTSCKGIISMVRIVVAPEKVMSSLSLANKIREMGFEVTLNVMYLPKWHQDSIFVTQLKEIEQVVSYLYLVDSYGGMFPDQLRQVLNRIKMKSDIKIGFHAHNNLEMALIYSLTAMDCGVDITDSTVMRMGRGAGNLKTEWILSTLHCLVGNEGHRLETVFDQFQDTRKIAVLPLYPRTMGTYVPEAIKSNAYQLKDIAFTDKFKEPVTALAIETALKLQVKSIYFVGYDGYEGKVSAPEMELFTGNEALFEKLDLVGIHACSLKPTRYSRLQQESVFAYI